MVDSPARLYLQITLEEIFSGFKVYFRPPENLILKRPCIVYTTLSYEPLYANNLAYSVGSQFQITFLSDLPGLSKEDLKPIFDITNASVRSNRSYVENNIAHDVFTVTIT